MLADHSSYTVTTYIEKTKRREENKREKINKKSKRRKLKLNYNKLKVKKCYQVISL